MQKGSLASMVRWSRQSDNNYTGRLRCVAAADPASRNHSQPGVELKREERRRWESAASTLFAFGELLCVALELSPLVDILVEKRINYVVAVCLL